MEYVFFIEKMKNLYFYLNIVKNFILNRIIFCYSRVNVILKSIRFKNNFIVKMLIKVDSCI